MSEEDKPQYSIDDLPNDPVLLKEFIRCQLETIGMQQVELYLLQEQRRELRRKNQLLRELIWPSN